MSKEQIREEIERLEEKSKRLIEELESLGVNLDFLKEDYKDVRR